MAFNHNCSFYWLYGRSRGVLSGFEPVYRDSILNTERAAAIQQLRIIKQDRSGVGLPLSLSVANVKVNFILTFHRTRCYSCLAQTPLHGQFSWQMFAFLRDTPWTHIDPMPDECHSFLDRAQKLGRVKTDRILEEVREFERQCARPLLITHGHYSGRPLILEQAMITLADAFYREMCYCDFDWMDRDRTG